jgi:hypothetical protein
LRKKRNLAEIASLASVWRTSVLWTFWEERGNKKKKVRSEKNKIDSEKAQNNKEEPNQ